RDGLCPKRVKNGESLSLLLLLAVRRMRREHTRRMSKDAEGGGELETLWAFHHCFIDILAACFFKQMRESYHRTFLSVKRRFFCPLNISQSSVNRHTWFGLRDRRSGWKREEGTN